ncbi:putative mitochondrial hypothetical protein [Leptomonas pyrrhocoris]|uniref:Pentapeptide repeat protein n=1 Tax=Leptomonas pyrrhocoris TaxID=157538 RepID=A0A0M9GBH6_LEPPY|nr:putative mitochondrial hypothetical protein [Leptomonas pyrrhocoris]KPA86789.1 putative mitochondrial hypothetical protein [Leptomonas pyrrhocoris]|eukprot:XP_015665228.1 putative mitochondrial hypothetical protein [Leptomonas pyrrhocoris]
MHRGCCSPLHYSWALAGGAQLQQTLLVPLRHYCSRLQARNGSRVSLPHPTPASSSSSSYSSSASPTLVASANDCSSRRSPHATAPEFDAEMLDALLAISVSLYADEALASPVAATSLDARFLSNTADVSRVSLAGDATATAFQASPNCNSKEWDVRKAHEGEVAGQLLLPQDAYASVDPSELIDVMQMTASCQEETASATQRDRSSPSNSLPAASSSFHGGAVDAHPTSSPPALTAVLTSGEVPLERKVLALMDTVSHGGDDRRACTATMRRGPHTREEARKRKNDGSFDVTSVPDASSPLTQASSLLLAGLDMKAVLSHGELSRRHLRHLSLTRCDFSRVRWSRVTVEDCDLARAIFYQAEWCDVVFRRCNFTGCLMKDVRCGGHVRFEDCVFRLAAVGLRCHRGESANETPLSNDGKGKARDLMNGVTNDDRDSRGRRGVSGVRFVRCDFDLSDFQNSNGLNDPASFAQCSNVHLASRFPLRARGGVC